MILLDIVMPVKDGMSMLGDLKENSQTRDIPVILLSNLSDPEKAIMAMKEGVYDYLVKSDWKIEDVVLKVAERLGDKV